MNLIELSDSQRRVYIDTSQVYETYLEAFAVFQLDIQSLPQYQFNPDELRMFPAEVVEMLKLFSGNSRLPAGIISKHE